MCIIGIISGKKKFQNIEKIMKDDSNKNEFTLININSKSISNFKNIKFDIIVYLEEISDIRESELKTICQNIKYLLINADLEVNNIFGNIETNIITFGLNHLASVTFSSISEEKILVSIQRSFKNMQKKDVEVGEYAITINKENRLFLYEILVFFTSLQINYGKITKN